MMSTPGPIRLEVPDLVDAVPGGPFEFEVRLTHQAAHDTSVLVRVVGALVGLEPARVVDLPAGQPVTTSVRMALPDGMSPGRHLVVVEVVERTVGQVVEAAEVTVAIARTRGVTITMTPATVSKRRGGKFRAMVRNHDDVEQRLRLKPVADRPGLSLVVSPPEVVLAPGESVNVTGQLKMKGFWLGQIRERWFTLTGDSSGASVYGRGLVLQKPIIGRSITRVVALVAILAVWLGGTLAVMRLLDPVTDDAATEAEASPGDGTTKPAIPIGDGETKATITVSGVVTADPDGSGVTVLYRPVTLADVDASEGKVAPTSGDSEVAGLRTETNADGEFEVTGLDANGIFEFRFAKAGHNTLTQLVQPNGADAVLEVAMEVGSGVISGTVVGPLGGPRGGAVVTLTDGAITYTTSTPSSGDTAGQFTFNNLSTPGTYVLDVQATGFGLASTIIELESGGVRQDVVVQISPDIGVLSGRVSSTSFESLASVNKSPAKGIMVTATDGTVTRNTSTLSEGDLAGTFRLVGLPLNRTYTITFEGDGWSTRTELVDFGLNFEPMDVSLIPSTGRIRGKVTTPPDTVSPAALAVTLASPDRTYKSTDAISADGDMLFTNIEPGTYVAIFESIGLADQVREVTVSAGQTSFLDVDMQLPAAGPGAGTFAVTIIDSASLAPMNATVTMRFRATGCGLVAGVAAGTCRWNVSGGALTISDLEPGSYYLDFTAEGYRPDFFIVDSIPGETVPVDMQLAPLGSVQGVVQDGDGGALQGANLTLYEANPDDTPGKAVAFTQVNDKGEYKFTRKMFSRNYVLGVTLSGHSDVTRPITGAVASTVNLDITMRSESQIAGQLQTLDLVTSQTDPVSLDQFTVYLRRGVDSTTSAWVDLLPQGLVRTLGGYRFGVTPNKLANVTTAASAKYAICIQRSLDATFDPANCDNPRPEFIQIFDDNGQGIEIERGELRVISATFTPFPASVSGVVRLPNGATVPEGLTVELRRVNFDNKVLDTFTTVTDNGGRFGFDNMAPTTQIDGFKPPTPQPLSDGTATATGSASSWRIQVRSENGSYNGVRFDLGPNAKYDMDVRMQEGTGRLEFFMMDDLGDPIKDAVVYVMRTTTGAQNITYDDLRYQNSDGSSRCASLPAPTDVALTNGVPLSGCTDSSGSIKFDVVSAPVQYYVAIGMADKNGFAELLQQVIPVRVGIDATESRSLRQTWYYGDSNVIVSASDPDRVPTAQLAALAPTNLKISYELIATTGATPVPVDNSIPCYNENVYTWLGQTGVEGLTPNGECFINDMRPGTYRITAVLSDPVLQKVLQTTTSAVAIVQPGRQKAVVPIVIPVIQRELQVRVIDGATNTTVSGATVVVNAAGQPATATKATGNDGQATFSSTDEEMPPPGIVFVTVGYPGFATTSASLNVRSGEQQTITISLATSVAEARVAVVDDDGDPVSGATVTVDGETITEASCVVPRAGWYCLRAAQAGIATVVVSKAGYRTVTVPMAVANPGGGTATVVLGASTGRLYVEAIDAATGAEVSLGAGDVSIIDQGSLTYDPITRLFTGVSPGIVRVAVAAQGGYAAVTVSASVAAGATASATVRLNRVSDGLVVTVVDTMGNPIPGATVSAGGSGPLALCAGGVTNRYCLFGASPGVIDVSASKAGYTSVLLYTTVNGDGTGSIALVLRQLTGNLLVNVINAATGVSVAITPSNVTVSATTDACVATGIVGQCRFDGLASGAYTVAISGVAGFQDATASAGAPLDGMTGTVNVALVPSTASVAVQLRTPSGLAISGASVTVSGTLLTDDGGGRYSGTAPVGVTAVEVSADGYLSTQEPLVVGVNGGAATIVLNPVTAPFQVRVVDELGAIIAGASVTVSVGVEPVTMTLSGDVWNGAAPLGIASVTASASGYSTVEVLTSVNDAGGAVAVVLRAASTEGGAVLVLTNASSGQPLTTGVSITATNSAAASAPAVDTTDAALGRYGLVGYEAGLWTVTISADGYLTRVVTLRVRAGVSSDIPIDLSTNTYALVGTVASAVGGTATSTLVGATVTLTDGTDTLTATTDVTGRYVFASVTTGAWTVAVGTTWATTNGYDITATSSAQVNLVQNGATVTQDLVVDAKPGGLSVTVLAATGAPASGVDVWIDVNRDGVRDAGELQTTDGNGAATLASIPAGVYQLVLSDASNRYATTSALVLVERNLTSNVTFGLAAWGVSVGMGVEAVPVAGLGAEPVTLWVQLVGVQGTVPAVSTVSNGASSRASFEAVAADTYAIELSGDNTTFVGAGGVVTVSGIPYTVPDLEPLVVEENGADVDAGTITLVRQTVQVTFSVVDRNGAALNAVQVGVSGDALLSTRTAFTTSSGLAVMSLPAVADYTVEAALAGYGATTSALSVGATDQTVTLTMPPDDASLEVTAVDAASPSTVLASGSPTVWVEDLATGAQFGGYSQALYPGRYRVTVSVTGYVDYVTTLTLAPGERRTLTAPMTSNAPGGVMVSLRSTAGAAVTAVSNTIYLVDSSGSVRNDCVVQGDTSMCAFASVPAGPYSVTVSATGYVGYESISVSTGVTTSATVTVNFTGTLWVKVEEDPAGTALVGATVTVEETGTSCVTGGDGVCYLTGLNPTEDLHVIASYVWPDDGTQTNFQRFSGRTVFTPGEWSSMSQGAPLELAIVGP